MSRREVENAATEETARGAGSDGCEEEEMHPDWHHSYLGVKCFVDKYVSVGVNSYSPLGLSFYWNHGINASKLGKQI